VCMPPTTTFSALCLAWADLPIAIKKLESTQWSPAKHYTFLSCCDKFKYKILYSSSILVEYDI
jgi:hypothetical protein